MRSRLCLAAGAAAVWCGAAISAVAAAAPARDDIGLALPAEESSERPALLDLLRRSREEIARAAGVPPRAMRVTVHPTVESFGQATGQSWYSAGATRRSDIHLLSIAVLRRNGQLERVVRHEVAHVLIDRSLDDRPLWVREGMAGYFAGPSEATNQGFPVSLRCPSNDELRRPSSREAQRDAYARAEACVRARDRFGRPVARHRTLGPERSRSPLASQPLHRLLLDRAVKSQWQLAGPHEATGAAAEVAGIGAA